jgi:hypothetical protein
MRTAFSVRRPRARGLLSLLAGAVLLAAGLAGASAAGSALATTTATLQSAAGQYFPITPVKILDTRDGTGGVAVTPLAAGATVDVLVTGGDIPDQEVSDVYMMINAINPSTSGCLDDYDTDLGDPGICAVSFDAGNNASDSDIVSVGTNGTVSITNTSAGTVDVSATVMGYYQDGTMPTAGDTYVGLPVAAIADTRSGLGAPDAQIPAGGSLNVQVAGQGGIPAGADGAAVYIGAANASAAGFVSAYPTGGAVSTLSALSYVSGETVHNLYFGALSPTGQLTLVNNGSAPVDLTVSSQGYLADPTATTAGSTYADVAETKVVDTRFGTGVPLAQVPSQGSITFDATGMAGIPSSGVSAVAETVRALSAQNNGFLSIYPAGTPDPQLPGVNFTANGNQDNDLSTSLVSDVGTGGQETITNHSAGPVDVVVAVRGYYVAPTVPSAPDGVGVTVAGQSATVSWNPPQADGGSPITGYQVTAAPDTATVTVDSGTHQAVLTGLTSAATDSIAVRAVNAVGSSVQGIDSPAGALVAGIVSEAGADVPGATVTLYAWPNNSVVDAAAVGDSIAMIPEGTATTNSTGAYAIAPTDMADIEASASTDNITNFEVVTQTPNGMADSFDFPRQLVPTATGGVELAVDSPDGSASTTPDLTPQTADLNADNAVPAVPDPDPPPSCHWQVIKNYGKRSTIIGVGYDTLASGNANATFTYSQSKSQSSTIEVAVSATGEEGTFKARGSVSVSTGETSVQGFPGVNGSHLFRTFFDYKRFFSTCTGQRKIRATSWILGATEPKVGAPKVRNPSQDCVAENGGHPGNPAFIETDNRIAYTFTNGVDFSGTVVDFKFSVTTGYTADARLRLNFFVNGQGCAIDAPPNTADHERLKAVPSA